MDPPQCVQNAMMKQDKKPFTYTPGGINLNEIKSPRLGRRIELNAAALGVGELPSAQPPHPAGPTGPLPPSALAAMHPQTQVQVFPGPPPPPPMMKNIPPPPPPPTCPLPTQKVTTGDNQVLERPDMTKIIPDNPMALLRRTGGPAPRKSFVEEMFAQEGKAPPQPPQRGPQSPQHQPQYQNQQYRSPESPKQQPNYQQSPQPFQQSPQPFQQSPQPYQPPPQQYQPPPQQYQPPPQQYQPQVAPESQKPSYQPPVIERTPSLRNEQPTKKSTAHLGSIYIPPINQQQNQQQQRVVSPPSPPERFDSQQVQSPGTPTLKQAPKPWEAKKNKAQEELPPWAKRENQNGTVQPEAQPQAYQPPPQQERWQPQQQPQPQPQQNKWQPQAQPQQDKWQPQPQQDKWQPQAQVQQQPQQQPQNRWQPQQQQQQPRTPPTQQGQPNTIRINIITNPSQYPQEPDERQPNAVYITQPIVLQHPGDGTPPPPFVQLKGQAPRQQQANQQPRQQQVNQPPRQQQVDSQGARIIPIQVEGRGNASPQTPGGGNDRSFNRQQSWTPAQSNSFKVIQKITHTDDEDDDTPVTHHSPRYPQNFQQTPGDQMRKLKLQESDRELVNRFKQDLFSYDEENPRYRGGHIPSKVFRILEQSGVDDESLQREEDPRYRGAAIPSKAFKILQNTLDGVAVPQQNEQQMGQGPIVRTIPVQIEGNGGPQKYVHPSEQTVPEPKKYTGSNIPSRSFKILQAMTAPDACANAEDNEDIPYPPYDQNYPYYYPPPPYWYPNYYYPEQPAEPKSRSGRTTPRATPVPYWGHVPTYPGPAPRKNDAESDAETYSNYYYPEQPTESKSRSGRTTPRATPLPFWGYSPYPPVYPPHEQENAEAYSQYPPYYDPYYYYHYGYPPMPPYPYYEYEDSGTDTEMAYYNRQPRSRRNSLDRGRRSSIERSYSTTSSSISTPMNELSKKLSNIEMSEQKNKQEEETDESSESDSDTETETEDPKDNKEEFNGLRSIKSVNNINVYYDEDEGLVEEVSTSEDTTEDTDEISMIVDEEVIPHQLSVIFEESERTESRVRSSSVLSDSTTIADKSDEEIDDVHEDIYVEIPNKDTAQVYKDTKIIIDQTQVYKKTEGDQEDIENHNNKEETISKEASVDSKQENDWWSSIGKSEEASLTKEKTEEIKPPKEVVECKKQADEEFKVIFRTKSEQPVKRVSSIYDELREEANEESSQDVGKLMEIESFAEKLEELKRNSGLWNFNFNKESSNTEKESTNEVAKVKTEEIKQEIKDETKEDTKEEIKEVIKEEPKEEPKEETEEETEVQEKEEEEEEEVDFWSAIKGEDSDEEIRRRRESLRRPLYSTYSTNSIESSSYDKSTEGKKVTFVELNAEEFEESDKEEFETVQIEETEGETQQVKANVSEEKSECNEVAREENVNVNVVQIAEDSVEYCTAEESNVSEDESKSISSSEPENKQTESQATCSSNDMNNNEDEQPTPMTIRERIQALKASIEEKKRKLEEREEIKVCVKDRVSAIEMTGGERSKTLSTKSSLKSFEEYSEEEGDSGVISDISRHISDTEEFPELNKLTRYQRAATHSRLFKLLQDECEEKTMEETTIVEEDKFSRLSVRQRSSSKDTSPSRSQLSLPLKKCTETTESSLCSSGITSPGSPVNEKLANELVQSLLKRKKGQTFRNMPKERILDAAKRILQEDTEASFDSPSDCASFLSPLRGDTQSSTPAQTPQEFYGNYNEYKQYYESWSEGDKFYDDSYDILPSKAFKLLQEHSGANRIGIIEGLIAKCPRILSSKNVHKELMKLIDEEQEGCSSSDPEKSSPDPNEVTNTS